LRILDGLTVIHTYDLVGKLFFKVKHIELSVLSVYFKGFIAKHYTTTEEKFI